MNNYAQSVNPFVHLNGHFTGIERVHSSKDFLFNPVIHLMKSGSSADTVLMIDSILTYSFSPAFRKISYNYDINKRIVSSLWESKVGNSWERYRKELFDYYPSNKLKSILTQIIFENEWNNDLLRQIFYDSSGQVITELYQYWDNLQWINDFKVEHQYLQDTIILVKKDYVGNIWLDDTRNVKCYKSGFLITAQHQNWNDGWENKSLQIYEYESYLLKTVLTKNWDGIDWSDYGLAVYDHLSDRIVLIVNLWTNGKWVPEVRRTNIINQKGYCIEGTWEIWENNSWVLSDGGVSVINPDGFELHISGIYKLNVYYDSPVNISEHNSELKSFSLEQNYPNPFNPSTNIKFSLPIAGVTTLQVYDVLGREIQTIVDEYRDEGIHQFSFDGSALPSGVYIYQLRADNFILNKKMSLIK